MKDMGELKFPEDIRYSDDHEWARAEGETVRVGITDYAQDQLGDITFVEVPEVGDSFGKGEEFGVVESTKAASEMLMPIAGRIAAVNTALEESPDLVNQDPYGKGWIIDVKPLASSDLELLMTRDQYMGMLKETD